MQVVAFFLKRSKTYFENAGIQSKEMVLSIPTYASNVER
jgi:heat shock protein 4